jgi:hypothetical protein
LVQLLTAQEYKALPPEQRKAIAQAVSRQPTPVQTDFIRRLLAPNGLRNHYSALTLMRPQAIAAACPSLRGLGEAQRARIVDDVLASRDEDAISVVFRLWSDSARLSPAVRLRLVRALLDSEPRFRGRMDIVDLLKGDPRTLALLSGADVDLLRDKVRNFELPASELTRALNDLHNLFTRAIQSGALPMSQRIILNRLTKL